MTQVNQPIPEDRRCQGWRRHGGAFTLGPVTWHQCTNEGITMLTVLQEGEEQTLPACQTCWQEALCNEAIMIIRIGPMPKLATARRKT